MYHDDNNDDDNGQPLDVNVPPDVHTALLRDHAAGGPAKLLWVIVWADRAYDRCPRCGHPSGVRRVLKCPVALDDPAAGPGALVETPKWHGCGEWLAVPWAAVPGTAEDLTARVVRQAEDFTRKRATALAANRAAMQERLLRQLRDALTWLNEPLKDGEHIGDRMRQVTTGSDLTPGVYRDHGQWVAWTYDPDGSGDPVTVTPADLSSLPPQQA